VDGVDRPSIRLPYLTIDWEFKPHAISLKKERKKVWWAEEDLQKNVETRAENLRSEEGLKEEQ
jgi:hypothetical protein